MKRDQDLSEVPSLSVTIPLPEFLNRNQYHPLIDIDTILDSFLNMSTPVRYQKLDGTVKLYYQQLLDVMEGAAFSLEKIMSDLDPDSDAPTTRREVPQSTQDRQEYQEIRSALESLEGKVRAEFAALLEDRDEVDALLRSLESSDVNSVSAVYTKFFKSVQAMREASSTRMDNDVDEHLERVCRIWKKLCSAVRQASAVISSEGQNSRYVELRNGERLLVLSVGMEDTGSVFSLTATENDPILAQRLSGSKEDLSDAGISDLRDTLQSFIGYSFLRHPPRWHDSAEQQEGYIQKEREGSLEMRSPEMQSGMRNLRVSEAKEILRRSCKNLLDTLQAGFDRESAGSDEKLSKASSSAWEPNSSSHDKSNPKDRFGIAIMLARGARSIDRSSRPDEGAAEVYLLQQPESVLNPDWKGSLGIGEVTERSTANLSEFGESGVRDLNFLSTLLGADSENASEVASVIESL